jgi:hypothetical protein
MALLEPEMPGYERERALSVTAIKIHNSTQNHRIMPFDI